MSSIEEPIPNRSSSSSSAVWVSSPSSRQSSSLPTNTLSPSRAPAPDVLPQWITEADVDVYAAAFEKGGFFGPCSYYRNMDANWERSHDIPASVYAMPTGFLTGALDPVAQMMPNAAEEMAAALPDYRGTTVVEDAAHWVQQEKPAETNVALLSFLSSL